MVKLNHRTPPDTLERVFDHRPVDPPKPVWIRLPPAGRRKEALGVKGLLWAWGKEPWFGSYVWCGSVSALGEDERWWTAAKNLLERDED